MGSNIHYYITTLHYFISLEIANTQKSDKVVLTTSSWNLNASVATSQYPQIYNFSFKKDILETLCRCTYLGF